MRASRTWLRACAPIALAATPPAFVQAGQDRRWELALIGRNLTNKRNLINANDRNGTGGGKGGFVQCSTLAQTGCDKLPDITGTPTQPRAVTLQAMFHY